MSDILLKVLVVLFVGGLLLMLWFMLRFGLISDFLTRGAHRRLRRPDQVAVERICGFGLPPSLAALYRESDLVERREFTLVDESRSPPARWFVGWFNPLAAPDVRECRLASGVAGVPIANDCGKGTYYVARDGSVRLSSPNVPAGDIPVTASVEDFFGLPIDNDEDDADDEAG